MREFHALLRETNTTKKRFKASNVTAGGANKETLRNGEEILRICARTIRVEGKGKFRNTVGKGEEGRVSRLEKKGGAKGRANVLRRNGRENRNDRKGASREVETYAQTVSGIYSGRNIKAATASKTAGRRMETRNGEKNV